MFKVGLNLREFSLIRSSNKQLNHDLNNSGDRGENFLLRFEQLPNSLLSDFRHALHLFTGERSALRCPLHFDELAGTGHDKIHIDIGPAVLLVKKVQKIFAADDTHAHGRDEIFDRVGSKKPLRQPRSNSFPERHIGTRDRSRPRSPVGLDHVAIDPDRLFTETSEISNSPKASTNTPLNI